MIEIVAWSFSSFLQIHGCYCAHWAEINIFTTKAHAWNCEIYVALCVNEFYHPCCRRLDVELKIAGIITRRNHQMNLTFSMKYPILRPVLNLYVFAWSTLRLSSVSDTRLGYLRSHQEIQSALKPSAVVEMWARNFGQSLGFKCEKRQGSIER